MQGNIEMTLTVLWTNQNIEQIWHVNLWLLYWDEPLKLSDILGESLQFPENPIIIVNQNTLLEFKLQSYNLLK